MRRKNSSMLSWEVKLVNNLFRKGLTDQEMVSFLKKNYQHSFNRLINYVQEIKRKKEKILKRKEHVEK